jgi:hypothetical protein
VQIALLGWSIGEFALILIDPLLHISTGYIGRQSSPPYINPTREFLFSAH